jgi:small neutral amino acid transporter SnatA (MarC family)
MIPLFFFFVAWLIVMALFSIMAFFTVYTNLKNGLSSQRTYVTTAVFLGVILIVFLFVGGYALTVNWNTSLDLFGGFGNSLLPS